MAGESSFVPLRSVWFAICFLLTSTLITTAGCDSPTEGDYGFKGEWEGYIGFTMMIPPLVKGDFTLNIEKSRDCGCYGSMSGVYDGWGDFELTFTGCPIIDVFNSIRGEMTVTRYRAGVDTLVATASISGYFSDLTPAAFGEWNTVEGSPFAAGGRWGASKK